MRKPVDLIGGFYTDDTISWSCQDTVNYIPVAAETGGTLTVSKLVDAPGLKPWLWIGHTQSGTVSGPVRGLHDVEGQLFAVCGRTLYQISNAGVAIPRGTIPGVGRVSMAHNQRSTGNELIVVNGSAGYVWNTGTQTFNVVTDAGYPGASVVDFIDGYLMQVEPFGRFLFHSDLADALEYNTLDRFEAETAPDRTLGIIVNHQEVWAFGERTIDVFGNAGTAQGTFQNKGVSISRGCAAKWSPAVIDNGVAWLGDDLKVYHANGYSPVRISTRAVEVALSECSRTDLRNAFSFVWEDLSHAVYYLTVPNGPTFGYDFSSGLWHRRSSWHPERDLSGRWRINDLVRHNGQWIAGDYQTGKLYVLDWDYMLEGCEPLVRERVSPVAHNDGRAFTIDSAEVLFGAAGPATECAEWPVQPVGPTISGDAPDGAMGWPYAGYAYNVVAGDAPIASVEIVSGGLPEGLVFSSGEIGAGTPEKVQSSTFTIRVTDTSGLLAELVDTIVVTPVSFATRRSDNGILIVSPTGEAWGGSINSGLGAPCYLLKCAGGNVYCFGDSGGRVSTDAGQTWTDVVYDGVFDKTEASSITYAEGVWLLAMSSGRHAGISTDGVTFAPVEVAASSRGWFGSAASGSTFIVGSTQGTLYRSIDACQSFSQHQMGPGTSSIQIAYYNDVHDRFLAYRSSANNEAIVYFSHNSTAAAWTQTAPGVSSIGSKRLISLAEGNVLLSSAESYASDDPIHGWVRRGDLSADMASPSQLNNVTHNGRYIIAGVAGRIDISTDANQWVTAHNEGGLTWLVASLGEWAE